MFPTGGSFFASTRSNIAMTEFVLYPFGCRRKNFQANISLGDIGDVVKCVTLPSRSSISSRSREAREEHSVCRCGKSKLLQGEPCKISTVILPETIIIIADMHVSAV